MKSRIDLLVKRLNATDAETFAGVIKGNKNATLNTEGGRYVYINNGANVLAVAHVDTVEHYPKSYWSAKDKRYINYDSDKTPSVKVNGMTVTSIKLDDRLGVHMILDLLPLLGIKVDVLLTDEEEWANSSAYYFTPPKGKVYNWAFSFDRRGVGECVMYQYDEDKTAVAKVVESGWYFGTGTYSDISDLDIGCTCFNFSAGFISEHTDGCYCQYDAVMYNVQLFKKFYDKNKNTRFPFDSKPKADYYSRYNSKWWKENKYSSTIQTTKLDYYDDVCVICGKHATTWDIDGSPVCDNCAFDLYDAVDKECSYCGMPLSEDGRTGEQEDEQFKGICTPCAVWLRDNMSAEELKTIGIRCSHLLQ